MVCVDHGDFNAARPSEADVHARRYNMDESRIYLTGNSDGGTGTLCMAVKAPTVFASFLPLVGNAGVTVTGATVQKAVVAKDTGTLPVWTARDNDRTMLCGAALSIVVP